MGLLSVFFVLQACPSLAEVVVSLVAPEGAAAIAGIQAGDRLATWTCREKAGEIHDPFDLRLVEILEGPRGCVILRGARNQDSINFNLNAGEWRIRVRPDWSMDQDAQWSQVLSAIQQGEFEEEAGSLKSLLDGSDGGQRKAWISFAAGVELFRSENPVIAGEFFQSSRNAAAATGWQTFLVVVEQQCTFLYNEGSYPEVLELLESVFKNEQWPGRETLVEARILELQGLALIQLEGYEEAEDYHSRALRIRSNLAPESLAVAASLEYLAIAALYSEDLNKAEGFFNKSLNLMEKLARGTVEHAASMNNLAVLYYERGELDKSERLNLEALEIRKKLNPGSLATADSLINLGAISLSRGRLEEAEQYYRESLEIIQKASSKNLALADVLNNLGDVAKERRDLLRARDYHKRALEIEEQLMPESLRVADTWNKLGVASYEMGDLKSARQYYSNALALREKSDPESDPVAETLNNLGTVACDEGEFDQAQKYLERALQMRLKLNPESLEVANSYNNLGYLAERRSDFRGALELYEKSLRLREKLSPGSFYHAESLHEMGMVLGRLSRSKESEEFLRNAVEVLEAQVRILGGTREARSGFSARFYHYYRDYIDQLSGLGKYEEAFRWLEKSRAHQMLAMFAEREVNVLDAPEHLLAKRKALDVEYDRIQSELQAAVYPGDREDIEKYRSLLRDIREKQEELDQEVRRSSPHYASLHYPQPLDLRAAQQVLEADTLLLAYSVGRSRTILFQVGREQFRTEMIPLGAEQLSKEVDSFRRLIRMSATSPAEVPRVREQGQKLYTLLLGPAERLMDASRQILISPDGALHLLPFAALLPAGQKGDSRYVIEWKPVSYVQSATVYNSIREIRKSTTPYARTLAAFGDPEYATSSNFPASQMGEATERGLNLDPLPSSRTEVELVTGMFEDAVQYLGKEATEERAKSAGSSTRFLHFACHGLVDRNFPLNSSLALSTPAAGAPGDNGFLQAWEIFERMRIDSELVVLSACETGIGKDLGGEGLMGLNRAFQYAGARSVIASLWSIADQTTAVFMTQFYSALKQGKSKSEALQAAQVHLITDRITIPDDRGNPVAFDASSPFFWAAFQLNGDWM